MVDPLLMHRWTLRTAYVLAALLVIFFQLLPLDGVPGGWIGPDLLLALTFGFAARRPEYLPAVIVAAVMLLADLLLQRPPGLMALLVVLGVEALKSRARGLRERNFTMEWMTVAVVLLAILIAQRLVLAVLMVPQAALGAALLQVLATVAAYPLVVLVAHLVMGLAKPHPAAIDSEGRRA